jgi:hypothetical protein
VPLKRKITARIIEYFKLEPVFLDNIWLSPQNYSRAFGDAKKIKITDVRILSLNLHPFSLPTLSIKRCKNCFLIHKLSSDELISSLQQIALQAPSQHDFAGLVVSLKHLDNLQSPTNTALHFSDSLITSLRGVKEQFEVN